MRKVRRALGRYGVWRTLGLVARNLWRPLYVRLSPGERAARRASLAFDDSHGTDTARPVYLGEIDFPPDAEEHARAYEPVEPELFRAMIARLPADLDRCTFVDLGSGKGRALMLAAELPFARIIGVELSPTLHGVAQRNVERFGKQHSTRTPIELVLGDACTHPLPEGPLVAFLYNPFDEVVTGSVARRLAAHSGRPLFVAYINPEHRHVFDGAAWQVHAEGPDWCILRAR